MDATARWLSLEGAENFRDLGGYRGRDGRQVRWGAVYRSNALSRLSDRDVGLLSALKIRLLCDLRTREEQEARPNRLPPDDPPEVLSLSILPKATSPLEEVLRSGRFRDAAGRDGLSAAELRRAMSNLYRSYARDHTAEYGTLLRRIAAAENRPTLVHCAAGKDRTGFAAALLLRALGVPLDQVLDDYELTNRVAEGWIRRAEADGYPPHAHVVIRADADFLLAAFDEIDARYGSLEDYLREGLGLDETLQAALCTALLD